MGAREMGGEATGAKASGVKATGAQENEETGAKGDTLMGERAMDNMVPGGTTAGLNATEGIRRKNYFEVVIEGVRRRARVFVGDSTVRKTDRAQCEGTTWWFAFHGKNRGYYREDGQNMGSGKR